MPKFRCLVRGEKFPGIILGEAQRVGFYATLYVDAESPSSAELVALNCLRNDPRLVVPPEAQGSDANVYFEAVGEVDHAPDTAPNTGFSFFLMST